MIPGEGSQWEYARLMCLTSSCTGAPSPAGAAPSRRACTAVMDVYSPSLRANYLAFVWGPGIAHAACSHTALLDRAEAIVFPVSGKSLVWFTFSFRIKVMRLTCEGNCFHSSEAYTARICKEQLLLAKRRSFRKGMF